MRSSKAFIPKAFFKGQLGLVQPYSRRQSLRAADTNALSNTRAVPIAGIRSVQHETGLLLLHRKAAASPDCGILTWVKRYGAQWPHEAIQFVNKERGRWGDALRGLGKCRSKTDVAPRQRVRPLSPRKQALSAPADFVRFVPDADLTRSACPYQTRAVAATLSQGFADHFGGCRDSETASL